MYFLDYATRKRLEITMTEGNINYSAKLYMIENTASKEFYKDSKSGLVPAFKLKSDATIQLKNLYSAESYRIIYAAPCEFFATSEVLWDAFFPGRI